MFETTIGPVKEAGSTVYLRPETAQGIFLDFKTVLQFARKKPPFGIAQVGKSFRNEITPGNFIFRTLEFEQMEMEFFVPPDEAAAVVRALARGAPGLVHATSASAPTTCKLRPHDADELSHYSSRHERRRVPVSRSAGPSSRASPTAATSTSPQHAEHSGEKLEYFDQQSGERYVPHVIEPAAGVGPHDARVPVRRLRRGGGRRREAHRAEAAPAPGAGQGRRAAARAQGRPAGARPRGLRAAARAQLQAEYDEGGSIGKRYRRQDEIGTPFVRDGRPPVARGPHGHRPRPRLARRRSASRSTSCRPSSARGSPPPWTTPKLAEA